MEIGELERNVGEGSGGGGGEETGKAAVGRAGPLSAPLAEHLLLTLACQVLGAQ